jgi:hypothetical protein
MRQAERIARESAKLSHLPIILGGVSLLLFVALLVLRPMWTPTIEDSHATAAGKVLETRIAVVGSQESNFGGRILYRIEALVRYDLHGQVQERWMPASEVTSDRDLLTLRLVKRSCEVYWTPYYPDNANCLLK